MLSPVGALAFVVGYQSRDGRLGAGVEVGLGDGDAHRRPVIVSLEHEVASGCLDDQVGCCVSCLGAVLPEGGDGHVDQRRVDLGEVAIPESTLRHLAGVVRFD